MATEPYKDDNCRVVIRYISGRHEGGTWNPGRDEVLAEVADGKDSMDKPLYRPAKSKEEVEQVLAAFARHIQREREREAAERCPRGGPDDR